MPKYRMRVRDVEDVSATDSENVWLSASSSVGDDSGADSSESGSISVGSEEEGDSSSDEAPISRLIHSRSQVVGMKRKAEEVAVRKGKGKLEGSETPVAKRSKALRTPTRSCLGDASGWLDCTEKFVMSPPGFRREEYFKSYGEACFHEPEWVNVTDEILSGELGELEHINRPCNLDPSYFSVVRAAFQIPSTYEVRMPEEGERIYHRGGDMWVGIPLEHFRAGLRLPLHRFFHTLFTSMRLALGQLGPNSIRKICAFIARCSELGLEPTLSLFWALHRLQGSRDYYPLQELHWVGKGLGGILVGVPSGNKGWHEEYVMLRGGDLGYLPRYRIPDGAICGVRRSEQWEESEVLEAENFVGRKLKGLWSERHFRTLSFLITHNCKWGKLGVYVSSVILRCFTFV